MPCEQIVDMAFDPRLLLIFKINVTIEPPIRNGFAIIETDAHSTASQQNKNCCENRQLFRNSKRGTRDKILHSFYWLSMNIVILAAGMGKRMQSALPKVLHPLAGKALLSHVIDTARQLSPTKLCVIYGHGGEQVPQLLQAKDLVFAKQEPQLGTGHAVMQAVPQLDDNAPTLILYGDVPLTTAASLQRLLDIAGSNKLGILTVNLDNPTGYGRIVRENDSIKRIV